ncbi:MAG: FmdB family zinc ribbon protein [Solirubrobacterales bacterium]
MVTYEFSCADCGAFEERRSMAAAAEPASCPRCGRLAGRRFGSFHAAAVPAASRRARSREERNGEAPERVAAKPAVPPHRHRARSRPWAIGH